MGVENEKERISAEVARSGPASPTAPILPTVNPATEKREAPAAATFHPAVYVMYAENLHHMCDASLKLTFVWIAPGYR